MISYAIIGSGMMGQKHIRNIQLQDGAEITAIAILEIQNDQCIINDVGHFSVVTLILVVHVPSR